MVYVIQTALELGVRIFLEIGPHGVLRYYLDEGIRHRKARAVALTSLQRGGNETRLLQEAWKKAWARNGWRPSCCACAWRAAMMLPPSAPRAWMTAWPRWPRPRAFLSARCPNV